MQKKLLPCSVVVLLMSAGLAACGGGGGGGGEDRVVPVVGTVQIDGVDPLYGDQWHLKNVGQVPGVSSGQDINVEPVWAGGNGGQGQVVVVVDDGVDSNHPDLWPNFSLAQSWNYQTYSSGQPAPTEGQSHGTLVAGFVAARDSNKIGIRGAAPRSTLASYNLLWGGGATDAEAYDAMTRNFADVMISSNSWGSQDNTGALIAPLTTLWHDGVAYGAANGRGGLGTIYVWAAGNGGEAGSGAEDSGVDNSNFDYQANNRHVMAVCSVDGNGVKAPHSEPGANLWLCAPGGTAVGPQMTTTDLAGVAGNNKGVTPTDYTDVDYTRFAAGTSMATPQVAGVAALMLTANSSLSWRDVRLILAQSARKNDPADSDWSTTNPAVGQPVYNINHKYGFGVVDAAAAVNLAKSWTNVSGALQMFELQSTAPPQTIPDNNGTSVFSTINVSGAPANLIIEFIEIEVSVGHPWFGDLEIVLTAPNAANPFGTPTGNDSVLAEPHACGGSGCEMTAGGWTFGSARHLGESPQGNWRLTVTDKGSGGAHQGTLHNWKIRFYGR